jgi:hypothetical protein
MIFKNIKYFFLISLYLVTASGWTDSILSPNVTRIRGQHIQELRVAIDAKRSLCGLASFPWSDALISPLIKIREIHISELRTAVNAAYVAVAQPPVNFSEMIVARATPIRASHIYDLRSAIDGLICTANINGQCGPAHGNYFASAPASGLCTAGTPTTFSSTNPWIWQCTGTGTGTTANCVTTTTLPPPPPTASCGPAAGGTYSSLPTSGFCTVGTVSGLVYKPVAFQGDIEWKCIVGGPDEVFCLAKGTSCSASPKTWTIGASTCTSTGNSFWAGDVSFDANPGYPGNCGESRYACGIDGTFSGPSFTTCSACIPATCSVSTNGSWFAGQCSGPGNATGPYINHGETVTYTDSTVPRTGTWTIRCNNGTLEMDSSFPYTCNP